MQQQAQAGSQRPEQVATDWTAYTDMPVGDILRRTRAYYALRIEDVEAALRIRSSQLLALEEGQIERLPGRVYAIGFVRAYAEFLGLDGDKMVHLFKAQLIGNKAKPELNFPVSASESKLPNPYILLASFAGVALVIGLFSLFGVKAPARDIPPAPVLAAAEITLPYGPFQEGEEPSMIAGAAQLAAIAPAAGTQPPADRIVIDVTDNSWVEIRNGDGKAILSRILKKGDSYQVPDEAGLVMDTGNIGALVFTVGDRALPPLGEPGDVKRSVRLDTLRSSAASAPAVPSPGL